LRDQFKHLFAGQGNARIVPQSAAEFASDGLRSHTHAPLRAARRMRLAMSV
jgi:hypothetical protein